jgi:hypothetical protein
MLIFTAPSTHSAPLHMCVYVYIYTYINIDKQAGASIDGFKLEIHVIPRNNQKPKRTAFAFAVCHRSPSLEPSACAALRVTLLQPRMSMECRLSRLSARRDKRGSFKVSLLVD